MLRIACESCRAPYQVDERRVPPVGLKMRCPKCGHSFVVKPNGETGPSDPTTGAAPKAEPAAVTKGMKATMVGVQAASPGKDLPSASKMTKPELPKARVEPPKAPGKPPPPPPRAPKADAPAADLPAARPPMATKPGFDDDLPAAKGIRTKPTVPNINTTDLDLPAAKGPAGTLPLAKSPAASSSRFDDVDLPAAAPSKAAPAAKPASGNPLDDFDLPAAKSTTELDLPAAKPGHEFDLPAAKSGREFDLPSTATHAAPTSSLADDPFGGGLDSFGEIDLPSLGGENLPSVPEQLPAVANNLPSLAGVLPAVANALPAVANALPAIANAHPSKADPPPPTRDAFADALSDDAFGAPTTTKVTDDAPAAAPHQAAFDGIDDLDGFGAAVLGASKQAKSDDSADVGFSETLAAPKKVSVPPAGVGAGFGEVDLGGSGEAGKEADLGASEFELPSGATEEGTEVALPVQSTITQSGAGKKVVAPAKPKKKSRAPAIFGAFLLVAGVAGSALHFTPFGAFGRFFISDAIHASEYDSAATKLANASRAKAGSDVFSDSRASTEDAAREHARLPRAQSVTAYAAVAEFLSQVRFGRVPERAARAKLWLQELPPGSEKKFSTLARALQAALDQDLRSARSGLEAAAHGPGSTAGAEEIALAQGEIELQLRNAPEALVAFGKAAAIDNNARAHFGLARAHALAEDVDLAKQEIAATLRLSPNHAGARVLRANILWDFDREEKSALADLSAVLDGPIAAMSSPDEIANAYAERGWIHLSRGRASEARTAFEAGLKGAPSNVRASMGIGELLFNEGRNSEALARFDLARQTDPNNPAVIVGSAKAKVFLERLQEAKNQLAAARTTHPKDWRISYWLARTESVLGNFEAAEKEFVVAVGLVNTKHPDAVLPYASLAGLLAERGRAKEAQAKLDEARKKLPDSALMQRALGDVALAEGAFDRAVTNFQAAIDRDPQDPNPHFRLATTFRRMRKMPEAQNELAKVEELDKDFPGLVVERGLLYEASGEIDQALAQFKRALDKSPNDLELQLRVGFAYISIDRADEAAQILHKVWERRQDSAQVNHALGRALLAQGESKIPEAMRFLRRAVELDATHAEYHLYVAMAANDSIPAQLGLAKQEVEKALALDSQLAEGYWQRGALLHKEGRVEDAIRDVKKAIELKPTRLEAFATLAECYEAKNEDASAVEAWRRALELKHPRPFWRYRFAKQMKERKQWSEVATHLALALPIAEAYEVTPGWLADAEYIAGEAFRATGRKKEAIAAFKRFLDMAPGNSPDRKDAIEALEAWGEKTR